MDKIPESYEGLGLISPSSFTLAFWRRSSGSVPVQLPVEENWHDSPSFRWHVLTLNPAKLPRDSPDYARH